jgi:hypothetical protein
MTQKTIKCRCCGFEIPLCHLNVRTERGITLACGMCPNCSDGVEMPVEPLPVDQSPKVT